ncbi:type I-U CRISPR-associated RAMP protein Csb1/Cas7u [Candidatus Palauibacter sp.]|uniref:type I-G CRISPR-associated RAMP protein Csb1/Cas7g n=1 Tax=Candidatus Palauibacter sp. TaxID=3101350 RepID=UPI003AF2DE90
MSKLTFARLRDAVAGDAVALRSKLTLKPAGGDGDKVFPPSYAVDGQADHKYAVEERRVGDAEETSVAVLLDSVASQANRAELALLEGWERGELSFPVPYVDFRGDRGLTDYERLTVLEAPHRLADAIFRDSLLDGTLFRFSDIGRAITDATPRDATEMYRHSPTSLLFGLWDSTGPRGGLGSKFQRQYVSEIVGLDAVIGKKVGSRIDPLQIAKVATDDRAFNSADSDEVWTFDEDEAEKDKKGKPVYASRGGTSGEAGQPSKINHGNVAPSIDGQAGGATISRAVQTVVISLAGLRRLRFKGFDQDAEQAARTAIAALGVAAVAYQYEADFDLRSRCLLLPTHPPRIELLRRDGSAAEIIEVDRDTAVKLLAESAAHATDAGIPWATDEIRLEPAPKLLELIKRSRRVSVAEPAGA